MKPWEWLSMVEFWGDFVKPQWRQKSMDQDMKNQGFNVDLDQRIMDSNGFNVADFHRIQNEDFIWCNQ